MCKYICLWVTSKQITLKRLYDHAQIRTFGRSYGQPEPIPNNETDKWDTHRHLSWNTVKVFTFRHNSGRPQKRDHIVFFPGHLPSSVLQLSPKSSSRSINSSRSTVFISLVSNLRTRKLLNKQP